jgi:signal transduction histidine kinase
MVHSEPSIEVHDRGPGIPEADKPHVCKRFWHGSNQGTGLGLAIVSRIAEAHAAALSISDREGGGTTIRLRLRQ